MKKDERKNERLEAMKTLAILAMACLLVGVLTGSRPFLYLAFAFLFVGVFIDRLSLAISRVWLKFAHILGIINTHIILFLVFYVFLGPLSLAYRLTHGDFLRLKKEEQTKTYFTGRDQTYTAQDLANPW